MVSDGDLPNVPPTGVEIRRTKDRGRGVFATTFIPHGTLIERLPVLLVPREQVYGSFGHGSVRCPALTWYAFDYAAVAGEDVVAVALGYGSIYNHDWPANARWERVAPDLMEIIAHRDIPIGREVTINYNGEPDDPEPLVFQK